MNNCVIVIPIYKEKPDSSEQASFKQVITILKKHPITIITYKELDLTTYKEIAKSNNKLYNTEYFDKTYFSSINGYNQLCLYKGFYKRFHKYKFILIYQLDAWVFKNELDYWCKKNYDYIGAPWFEHYSTHEENNNLWAVGNGGFSLRKTSYFIKVLSWKFPVKKITLKNLIYKFSIYHILHLLGYNNTINYFIKNYNINEDVFFSLFLKNTWLQPKLPTPTEAAKFSFEKSPTYLYKLCNNKLPFGCHAFNKYEYNTFWEKYISII